MNRKRIRQTWLSVLMLIVVNYGSVTAEVIPVASALHVLPPLGKAYDDLSNFDATLLDYLTVSICRLEADTCTTVQEFTSTDGKGLDHILLQEEEGEQKYHVNWDPATDDFGHEFEIRFLVAGLEVDAIECTPRGKRTVPIKFRIDNHPLIRAHVFCEIGLSAVEAAKVLIAEFSLTMEDLLPVLMASCFDCIDVSEVLKDTFELTAVDTVLPLIDAGCDCEVIGEALASTFGTTADDTTRILLNAGCDCEAVGSVLKNIFNVTPQSAAHILISAGCSCEATGDVLRNTFLLSDEEATRILVAAGCDDYLNLLAPTFAPQLRFDGGAFNFPMSAQTYYKAIIETGDWQVEKYPNMENTDSSTLNNSDKKVPTYYRAVRCGNQVRIFYWWFYGWQAPCFLNQGRHNGDWEQVMVTLSEDATEVAAVTFWQHAGWYTRLAYSDGQACPPPTSDFDHCSFELFDQTHPVVYVGRIAHGSYSSMGGSPDPIMTCLYHYDVRYFTNPALRLDTWANLVNIDAGTETWRQADVQWGYGGVKTSDRKDIDNPPVNYMMASCKGDSWYNPLVTNGCWLSQCRAGDKCNLFISLAYCVSPINIYDICYTIPTTDAGLLYKSASTAALINMDREQTIEFLAMVFTEDYEMTGQAEQDQSFETLAMVLDESLETNGEEPVVEDDFLTVPEAGQTTEMSPDPAVRLPYIAEVARLVLAMTLDINPDQLRAAFEDGLTPCQICEAQGMDISEVLAAEWPTREGIIQEAVASEFISPAEADWLRGFLDALPELCQEEGQFE